MPQDSQNVRELEAMRRGAAKLEAKRAKPDPDGRDVALGMIIMVTQPK